MGVLRKISNCFRGHHSSINFTSGDTGYQCLDDLPMEVLQIVLSYLTPAALRTVISVSNNLCNVTLLLLLDDPAPTADFTRGMAASDQIERQIRTCCRTEGVNDTSIQRMVETIDETFGGVIVHANFSFTTISEAGFKTLLDIHGEWLQSVNVAGCPHLSDEVLPLMFNCCPALQSLTLGEVGSSVAPAFTLTDIEPKEGNFKLVNLVVAMCTKIREKTFIQFLSRCPQLEALNISFCHQITNATLVQLASSCPKFHTLQSANCPHVSTDGINALAKLNMFSLDLRNCTGVQTNCIRELLLKHGTVKHCNFSGISPAWSDLQNAFEFGGRRLEVLTLEGCSGAAAAMEIVLPHSPKLITLGLSTCKDVNDDTLNLVAEHCKELQHLGLRWCTNVTNKGVLEVGAACHKLEELVLAHTSVTGKVLVGLPESLQRLDVSHCTHFGVKRDLWMLLKACPRLRILDIAQTDVQNVLAQKFVQEGEKHLLRVYYTEPSVVLQHKIQLVDNTEVLW
eukprot:TRINITY_DN68046_c6_g2_i1.p1 TRINITY_DN68046_c6_g2~~TRINITY_DN68046_c6_g2_i1.p1  ORF type:complete len:510 (-),score=23.84 TRINITY_DN68046_c6_g2_i1:102-1631(-)